MNREEFNVKTTSIPVIMKWEKSCTFVFHDEV